MDPYDFTQTRSNGNLWVECYEIVDGNYVLTGFMRVPKGQWIRPGIVFFYHSQKSPHNGNLNDIWFSLREYWDGEGVIPVVTPYFDYKDPREKDEAMLLLRSEGFYIPVTPSPPAP